MANDGVCCSRYGLLGLGIAVLLAAAVAGGIYIGQSTSFRHHEPIYHGISVVVPTVPKALPPAKAPPDLRGQVAALEANPVPTPATPAPAPAPANIASPVAQPTPQQTANPGPPPRFDFRDQTQPPVALPAAPVIPPQPPVAPATAVDVNIFAQQLLPLGEWLEVPGYQHCWRPRNLPHNWRPYTVGRWAYTPDGLLWISTEPWGDICYHYGSWIENNTLGWLWVPGRVWAPAWVAWRSSADAIGWAPLPPEFCTGRRPILQADIQKLSASSFNFVPADAVLTDHLETQLRPLSQNATLVSSSVNITNLHLVNNVVINDSIDAARLEKITHQKVERIPVQTAVNEKQVETLHAQGRPIFYTPKEKFSETPPAPLPQPRPAESPRPQDHSHFTPAPSDRFKSQDPANPSTPPTQK